ncbi:hypothetical protein N665_0071s0040 [Sinapis alba]|nr:hypothetical protein N665_0071s0040 [Sinapis alba]
MESDMKCVVTGRQYNDHNSFYDCISSANIHLYKPWPNVNEFLCREFILIWNRGPCLFDQSSCMSACGCLTTYKGRIMVFDSSNLQVQAFNGDFFWILLLVSIFLLRLSHIAGCWSASD